MPPAKNIRSALTQLAIWIGLALVLSMLYWPVILPGYAILRALCIISLVVILHYSNAFLYVRFYQGGKVATYAISIISILIVLSVFRYFLENNILPIDAKPQFFQISAYRPLFFMGSGGTAWLLSTLVIYALELSKKERMMLRALNAHNEARLQYLYSQINPHFLFNAMNNIYSLVITGSDKAPDMFLTLTELLRYTVYQKPGQKVAVADETHQIEMLIQLFCLRNDQPYHISFEKENIQGMIEPMILVPLAENCLKHCDFDVNENAYAKMTLNVTNEGLDFVTENSFVPMQQKGPGGVGLHNIQERLKLTYGDNHYLTIREEKNIFHVHLRLVWNKK